MHQIGDFVLNINNFNISIFIASNQSDYRISTNYADKLDQKNTNREGKGMISCVNVGHPV